MKEKIKTILAKKWVKILLFVVILVLTFSFGRRIYQKEKEKQDILTENKYRECCFQCRLLPMLTDGPRTTRRLLCESECREKYGLFFMITDLPESSLLPGVLLIPNE